MATDAQSLRVERSLSKSKRPHLETKAQVQEPDEYRRRSPADSGVQNQPVTTLLASFYFFGL
jgi:hypothetical protein